MCKCVGVLALLLCVSPGLHAQSTLAARRTQPPPGGLEAVQAGRSQSARPRLAGTITPEQQAALIKARPVLLGRIQRLFGDAAFRRPLDPIWLSGITLTPLDATFPQGANYGNSKLALRTEAAWLSQITPLPTASQTPPLLWLSVPSNNGTLLWVEARWPQRGAYLLTFFLKDVWPNGSATPRIRVNGVPTEVYPDPSGDDVTWSVACLAEDSEQLYQTISVHPEASGYGFMACCASKVVVSKIWLE